MIKKYGIGNSPVCNPLDEKIVANEGMAERRRCVKEMRWSPLDSRG